MRENLIEEFSSVINLQGNNENKIQTFLENNSELICLPVLLNHHLHFNCVISKFKLNNEYITDFAYLTKSSSYWKFVLMELESSNKSIFRANSNNEPKFSSDFNNAYDQILNWKAYMEENKDPILRKIDKIRVPLNDNNVRFEYCLIIGRNADMDNDKKRRALFAEKSRSGIHVMTYDSLINHYRQSFLPQQKIILSSVGDQGYEIKVLPQEVHSSIFAYVKPEYLKVREEYKSILKNQDYEMDEWQKGNLLIINDKYTTVKIGNKIFDGKTLYKK